jgi:hypothetical protein
VRALDQAGQVGDDQAHVAGRRHAEHRLQVVKG